MIEVKILESFYILTAAENLELEAIAELEEIFRCVNGAIILILELQKKLLHIYGQIIKPNLYRAIDSVQTNSG